METQVIDEREQMSLEKVSRSIPARYDPLTRTVILHPDHHILVMDGRSLSPWEGPELLFTKHVKEA